MRVPPGVVPLIVLALGVGGDPAGAAERAFWSVGGLSIRGSSQGYVLQTSGQERAVALPPGVEIEDLFALRGSTFVSARGAGEDRGDLYLALADELGLHSLGSPLRQATQPRENAVPLTSAEGELAGVAWLEGATPRSYEVRHAAWDGMRWSEPRVVAESAPGSQLALSAATLADGSPLLVWSRFDGQDDEVVFARFANGRWSAAQPIAEDNAVPDVTPSVLAVPGGALATWSRYDGREYRLVVSRFDGGAWSPPLFFGPAGASEPRLVHAGKQTWLSFASARPRGWGVLEVDSSGNVLREGTVPTAIDVRPAVSLLPNGELRLRWAGSESRLELQ
jgi:hypothetical protein